MTRRSILALVILMTAAAATAFYVGRIGAAEGAKAGRPPRTAWLRDAPDEAVQAEQRFEQEARELAETVRTEQTALSSLLVDANATGEQVFAQVDRVSESYAALLRTVGRHIVQVRDRLPQSQARSFMEFCAGSVRGHVQRRYRWRGGAQDEARGRGYMGGRGGGGGRGRGGPGYGRQYRGGAADRGLARRLQLTEEQVAWIQRHDPEFEPQSMLLREKLNQVHASLAATLDDPQVNDEELMVGIEELIAAHRALERRVAEHLVLLRPQLTAEQRERLSGLGGGPGQAPPVGARGVGAGFLAALALGRTS